MKEIGGKGCAGHFINSPRARPRWILSLGWGCASVSKIYPADARKHTEKETRPKNLGKDTKDEIFQKKNRKRH